MPVNDKILVTDYNNIRNKVANVLGLGSGTSGYGQTVSSPLVSLSSKVTVNEYASLRTDIINTYRHIYGVIPTVTQPVEGNTVRYNATGTTPEQATQPVVQYDRFADLIIANRFTIHPSQSKTVVKGSRTKSDWTGGFWNKRLSCTVTVTFTSATQTRYFFNSGGEIRFESARSGGTSSWQQNLSWSSLLNSAGVQRFGGQLPTTGFSPANGQNYYRLTSTYQVWYSISASSPYTNNRYQISARTPGITSNASGTARIIEFLIEWLDGYTDPPTGGGLSPSLFPPGDHVDGTIELSSTSLEATGVLVPVGAGNFTVESPQVDIGNIIQDPNGPITG
jgi:hypothetical protein